MKDCVYCGISYEDWKERGRIGCSNCISLIGDEYSTFIPRQSESDWEPPLGFPLRDEWFQFNASPFSEKMRKIDSYSLPFSYRFRVARNPKRSVYPLRSKILPSVFLEEWFSSQNIQIQPNLNFFSETQFAKNRSDNTNCVRISWNGGTLLMGDEDHLRWEYVTDSLNDLAMILESPFLKAFWDPERFDYRDGIGFLTSCPTNAGEGDKLSVALPDLFTQTGALEGFRLPTDWGFYREDLRNRLIIFRKNFGLKRKNSFFNLVSYLALLVILGKEAGKASFPP
ncbi:hypothetical protein LEP1GSC047_1189 [Leptospira inadai serovar Lyme str. 10]|uniref:ATP:guanido phosphotransferase, C-terminal catalytic domain protein n=2 Tax=Leptospira inadai serovar Lyme TaxID=293084 RepID=V6H7Q3_9LEPT|nr:hypothetical protein LEP1GSC047_1189 [Leptospira inadai serovar Lyme str. 10]PNV75933.1 ATP--guanido phosphotransferase [Leptospira inadai serovar Lyme]